jgi:hypothetical protein
MDQMQQMTREQNASDELIAAKNSRKTSCPLVIAKKEYISKISGNPNCANSPSSEEEKKEAAESSSDRE